MGTHGGGMRRTSYLLQPIYMGQAAGATSHRKTNPLSWFPIFIPSQDLLFCQPEGKKTKPSNCVYPYVTPPIQKPSEPPKSACSNKPQKRRCCANDNPLTLVPDGCQL